MEKRAEQELKEKEDRIYKAIAVERQRFYDVLEGLQVMVCLITSDYHITYTNQAFREKFGESYGRHCYEYCYGKFDGPCEFCESFKVLETRKPHHWETTTMDGSIINVYDYPFTDVDGSLVVLWMGLDITERKIAEEALRKSEKQALDLVEKLQQADQNKNTFINMLSHELRNPLASIMMSLDLLEKSSSGWEQATKALDIAKRQGKQLTRLVDDLLDITRISQNKIALKKENVELNQLIKMAVQDYKSQFINNNVRLEVKLTSPLYIEADTSRITQVISNLLHNSAKFTSNNDLVTVAVSRDTNTSEAVITVQDTGRGIDPIFMSNLFEAFMQVDKSLDRTLGGLGLGLAIVKGMVELHGGRVEAFSEGIGKGTKFTIRLPLPKENIGEQECGGKTDVMLNKSLKILMIEDNKDLAEIMCELLDILGHKAAAAYNGTEGISKARELRPDVVISDLGLPDMSGYEVAKMIRKDTELKDVFLIAMSGYAQPEDIYRSKEAGFDRHLGKPVALATLEMVLNDVK